MAKKHAMTEHEYRSYKKRHDYDDPLETEEGKVSREKAHSARQRRKTQARWKRQLDDLADLTDLELWEEDLILSEYERSADREVKNARTHKRRLKGLAEYEQ